MPLAHRSVAIAPSPTLHPPVCLQQNAAIMWTACRARTLPIKQRDSEQLFHKNNRTCALQELHGMDCSMAACLRGIGTATTCASPRLRRQPQSHHVRTDGCDLPRCRLSRPGTTSRPQVDGLCSCCQEAAQVVAGPKPRRHAAMLQSLAIRALAHKHGSSQVSERDPR